MRSRGLVAGHLLGPALVLLLVAGCGGRQGGAGTILLTVRYADEVTPALRASVRSMHFAVSGTETFVKDTAVTSELDSGMATIRFIPRAPSGYLQFDVAVKDANDAVLASGAATGVTIDSEYEVAVLVLLHPPAAAFDGGVDLAPMVMDQLGLDSSNPDLLTVDTAPMQDMASDPDLAVLDLAFPDMAMPVPDLSTVDLARQPDLVALPDLYTPPDLAGPVMISHTAEKFINNAGDLLAAVATIDTTTNKPNPLLDKNNAPVALPANAAISYDMMNRSMVLRIAGWTVAKGNDIKVVGMNQLIVLAAGQVTISARINASAVKQVPGPGGVPANSGSGRGSNGIGPNATNKTGGGGAGFAVPGAPGGDSDSQSGGMGGVAYGGMVMDWEGGSGGGNGGSNMVVCDLAGGPTGGFGGGGGGSIQITSAVGITIDATGSIDANGGGGQAGCLWTSGGSPRSMGGGGGGSGGIIFLEAPVVTVSGNLFANGGAGGGAGDAMGTKPGVDGQDGLLAAIPAAGGASSGNGGFGGAGGTDVAPKGSPTNRIGLQGAGGGGGAAGRILLHVRAPATVSGTVSPMPTSFVNL